MTGDDEDVEVAIDWSQLPQEARPFTIVMRCDQMPSLYRLDELLWSFDRDLTRSGSLARGGAKTPDTERWRQAEYLSAFGELIVFDRAKPTGNYVRVTFDVDEMMMERDRAAMCQMAELAQRVVPALKQQLQAFPIDVEY